MSPSWREVELRAARFAKEWEGESYEKGEAQSFYNDFFEVFGIKRRQVARFEEFVKLYGGGHGFIDLLWPSVLIAEQKSLGGDLDKARTRAGEYFDGLPADIKPRYQLVCDFQAFRLLDRDSRHKIEFTLPDLPKYVHDFAFMLGRQPLGTGGREDLNLKAAGYISQIYQALKAADYPERDLEALLTRLVFCLFADNTGIFQPRGAFYDLVHSCTDLGQMLAHLFQVLETPVSSRQNNLPLELREFPYINGSLFADSIQIASLDRKVTSYVREACGFDWSQVSPAIFGSLFQSVLTPEEQRDIGAFATSERNIRKVIDDLFFKELDDELEAIRVPGPRQVERLRTFIRKLRGLNFLDPACGCGNFLVIAYREVRALELRAAIELRRLRALRDPEDCRPQVNVDQCYGIERRSYSTRIAEAALWMTDHVANNDWSREIQIDFHRVPLKTSPTIVTANALDVDWQGVIQPERCSYILGNPPYKGPKNQSAKEKDQLKRLMGPGVSSGTLDLASGWILKAAEYALEKARVGLVVTHSVVQGEQVSQLWPVLYSRFGLDLYFAHQPFKWFADGPQSGTSNVFVAVVGLCRAGSAPLTKPLYVYQDPHEGPDELVCEVISPYLIPGDDLDDPRLTVSRRSSPMEGMPRLTIGNKPIDGGYYILFPEERAKLVEKEPGAERYIRPYVGADELLEGKMRYILMLDGADRGHLRTLPTVMGLVKQVRAYRRAEIPHRWRGTPLKKPNELWRTPTRFHVTRVPSRRFLVVPEVTSERREYIPIAWLSPPIVPSNLLKHTEGATNVHFALLTSAMHMAWARTVGGRLEGRNRYSTSVIYNNFPIPNRLDEALLERLANDVLDARDKAMQTGSTLEDIYDPDVMPANLAVAHRRLDQAVDRQYLGTVASRNDERVANLLNRYRKAVMTHQ